MANRFLGKTVRNADYAHNLHAPLGDRFFNLVMSFTPYYQFIVDWIVILVCIIIVAAPALIEYDWKYAYEGEVDTPEVRVIKRATLYGTNPADTDIVYKGKKSEADRALLTLQPGNTVTIIGFIYDDLEDTKQYLQVQTKQGNIGFIHSTAICEDKDLPELVISVPEVRPSACVKGTQKWLDRYIKVGETTRSEVDNYWWGKPIAVKRVYKGEKVYYPIDIRDGKTEYDELCITFEDSIVSDVSFAYDHKRKVLFGRIWLTDWFDNSNFLARFSAHAVTSEPIDMLAEERVWEPPTWLAIILGLLVLILRYIVFIYLYIVACIRLVGTILMPLGRIPFLAYLFPLILLTSGIYTGFLLYVLWGGFQWWSTIFCAIIVIVISFRWLRWCRWNHCTNCARFYTKTVADESMSTHFYDRRVEHYEDIKADIVEVGYNRYGQEVSRSVVGQKTVGHKHVGHTDEKRNKWEINWDFVCEHCGEHSSDWEVGDTLISSKRTDY